MAEVQSPYSKFIYQAGIDGLQAGDLPKFPDLMPPSM